MNQNIYIKIELIIFINDIIIITIFKLKYCSPSNFKYYTNDGFTFFFPLVR